MKFNVYEMKLGHWAEFLSFNSCPQTIGIATLLFCIRRRRREAFLCSGANLEVI